MAFTIDSDSSAMSAIAASGLTGAIAATTSGALAVAAADPITVHLSEDAWNGDAQFILELDGVPLAGPLSVSVPHSSGGFQDFTFPGDFGLGLHTVAIHFINDAWGGTPETDRNLFVGGIDFNGIPYAGQTAVNDASNGQPDSDPNAAEMYIDGSVSFPNVAGPPLAGYPDTLTVRLSEDAWNGDAQFTVELDGHLIAPLPGQTPGPFSVTASHASGESQEFRFLGLFGQGPHTVAIHFLNDAWGGTPDTDRNLYVDSISFITSSASGGVTYSGEFADNDARNGQPDVDPGAAEMFVNGTVTFPNIVGPTGATVTPDEPRGYVAPDASGLANGTTGPDDIFATGNGQTLVGNGGDDVFHVGTYGGLTLEETKPGISTVSAWSGAYTLNDGIDNLTANGAYGHALTGNAGNNVITGAGGDDFLSGGNFDASDDLLVGGRGADTFAYGDGFLSGTGHDTVLDFSRADGDKILLNAAWYGYGRIDSFDALVKGLNANGPSLVVGPDYIQLPFPEHGPGPTGTLTIHGITDLNASDWEFVTG